MLKITAVTADPYQKHTLSLPNGNSVTFFLRYRPQQFGWFVEELTYEDLVIRNIRITVSPNILFQFINQLPFGLACFSKDSREPTLQQDFSSGAATLYILTEEESQEYLRVVRGQV